MSVGSYNLFAGFSWSPFGCPARKKGVCVGYYADTGVGNDHKEYLLDGGIFFANR